MKPTWKNTLNSEHKHYGHIDKFLNEVVIPSGYPYFGWNGIVYKVRGASFEDTSFYTWDLK